MHTKRRARVLRAVMGIGGVASAAALIMVAAGGAEAATPKPKAGATATVVTAVTTPPGVTVPPVPLGTRAGFSPGGGFTQMAEADQTRELDAIAATGAKWFR